MIRRLVALAWLLALIVPAAAVADPPWSPPANVSAPHLFVDPVDVTASADGTALAWWAWQDGTGTAARTGWSLASRPPGATRSAPSAARRRATVAVEAYAKTRAIALTDRAIGPANIGRTRLSVAFGATSGSFGSQRTVADGPRLDRPVLAANANGDAAIAYFQDRGDDERPRDGEPAPGRRVASARRSRSARGAIRSVAVAVGPRGDVLVAWDARGTIRARYARPSSAGFQPIETISSDPTFFAQMQAAVDRRRALLPGLERASSSARAAPADRSSTRSPCARWATASAPPQLLERDGRTAAGAGRARDDRAATRPSPGPASTAPTPASAWRRPIPRRALARRQDVSPAGRDGVVSDLAARSGTTLVVWDNGSFDANQVFAAVAPPGAPFGARRGRLRRPGGARRQGGHGARADRGLDQPAGRLASRRAAWTPCRRSPRRRRAPARTVERRSCPVHRGRTDVRRPGAAAAR